MTLVQAGAGARRTVAICPRVTTPAPGAVPDLIGMAAISASLVETIFDKREVKPVLVLDLAHRGDGIGGSKGIGDISDRQSEGLQPRRVNLDLELRSGASKDVDAGHAVDRGEDRTKAQVCNLSKRNAVPLGRRERDPENRKDRRIGSPNAENRVPAGKSGSIVAMAPCVAWVAATMSSPHANVSAISAEPRLVVERICRTPGTCRKAISDGRVMSAAICSASRSPASIETTTRG